MKASESENQNVQQGEALTGPVNGQAVVNEITSEAVNQPTAEEQERQTRRRELQTLRITSQSEVPPEEPALSVDGVGFFARNDIHAVKAKQKAGKTTALKVCIAAWMGGQQFRVKSELEAPRMLVLDTEQKRTDVKLIVTDVMAMTGLTAQYVDDHLWVYALRSRNFDLLLDDLRQLVSDCQPDVVVVDGIVEFVASFNDEGMAKELIHELLVLSEAHHLSMVCVLHTNKADEDHNMRGHLGTMLAQKAGTVLECRKQGGIITVSCADARHEEVPDWSIMFDEHGAIVDADERRQQQLAKHKADLQKRRQEAAADRQAERLECCLRMIRDNGGSVSRKVLTEMVSKAMKLGISTIQAFIKEQLEAKTLYEVNGQIQASLDMALAF